MKASGKAKQAWLLILLAFCFQQLPSQLRFPNGLGREGAETPFPSPFAENVRNRSVSQFNKNILLADPGAYHLEMRGRDVWVATAHGLDYSSDLGTSWNHFDSGNGLAFNGVSALFSDSNGVWAAQVHDSTVGSVTVPAGGGLSYTHNHGAAWGYVQQPVDELADSLISYGINDSLWILPIGELERNVTYDVAGSAGTIWTASWAGGLRRSSDDGLHWQRMLLPLDDMYSISPTDTLWSHAVTDPFHLHRIYRRFDPRSNNNLLPFSAMTASDNAIWCGTVGGINKSTDGGASWIKYNHSNRNISGNWVIALHEQQASSGKIIWSANWKAEDPSESYGVSYTTNQGTGWRSVLENWKAYRIYSVADTVYVCTDSGLYRSRDRFEWDFFRPYGGGTVYDVAKDSLQRIWLATSNGLHLYADRETSWQHSRTYEPDQTKPVINSVAAADTFLRPVVGSSLGRISVLTNDPDGRTDVEDVWFTSRRPDGRINGPFYFANEGEGLFGLTFRIDTSALLGTYQWKFFARDVQGNVSDSVVRSVRVIQGAVAAVETPSVVGFTFALMQNYPNPFNPVTKIRYSIPEAAFVNLAIFNCLGQEVVTLVNHREVGGYHEVAFDLTANGRAIPSGVYFYRLSAGGMIQTRKCLVIR